MKNQNILTTVYFAFIYAILTIAVVASTHAQAQVQQSRQTQQEKFFMIFKIRKSQFGGPDQYEVYNMTTNMKKFPSSPNDKISYSLKDVSVDIYDCSVSWSIPYRVIDTTSTPNVIRTMKASIFSDIDRTKCVKEVNTLTNTTIYTGPNITTLTEHPQWPYYDINVNIKATLYPNGTGIVESKER
jgi:hypothetical protein